MADIEEYFPRGGKKPTNKSFKQGGNFLGVPERVEKKKKKPKKKNDGDDGYLSDDNANELFKNRRNNIVGLSYKTIKEGVLILARIRNVHETKLIVMMPGRLMGSVMACHISEAYNKVLEAYVNDQVDKVKELPQMFRPGQYIALKVLEMEGEKVMLTAMPQHVNAGKKQADLHKSTVLQAAVSSMEDHGYVMDIGIPNTRAFLPKAEVNSELDLDIGMITWCAIKSVTPSSDSSVVTLSTLPSVLQHGIIRHKPDTPLLPGSQLQFTVESPMDNGIQGQVFEDAKAYILRQHIDKVKGKRPALGQRVTARVLYVMPTLKTPFLTMKNIFESAYPNLEDEQKLKDGDIVEDAQVLKISGRGVLFKLGQECTGAMSMRRIRVDEDLTDEEVIAKSYPIGSTHKVRVLCYNLMDYIYSVSDQPSVLNQKYFSLGDLRVGQIVDATVKYITEAHVVLNLGRFTGMVPHAHIAEAGVVRDPKKGTSKLAKQKYKVGQEVRARVLTVDPVRQALFLTMKPSLLDPELEVLSSCEQAEVGKAYTGIIKYIRDFIIVGFFDNLTAFVPKHFVTKEPVESLTDAFHNGQIVNCTLLSVDKESKKLTGSLTTIPFWPAKRREKGIKRKGNLQKAEVPKKKKRSSDEEDSADEDAEADKSVEHIVKESKKNKKKDDKANNTAQNIVPEKKNKKGQKQDDAQKADKQKNKSKEDSNIVTQETKSKRKRTISEKSSESDAIETDIGDEETFDSDDLNSGGKFVKIMNEDKQETQNHKESKSKRKKKDIEKKTELALEDEPKSKSEKKKKGKDTHMIETAPYADPKTKQGNKKKDTAPPVVTEAAQETDQKSKEGKKKKAKDNQIIKTVPEAELKTKEGNRKKDITPTEGTGAAQEIKLKSKQSKKKTDTQVIEPTQQIEHKAESEKNKNKAINEKENKHGNKTDTNRDNKLETLKPVLDLPSAKEFWSAKLESASKRMQEDVSSSSDDEQTEQPKKKRKKLSVKEKLEKMRAEEERIRELERRAIESESQPRSSDQFERALLANPDCSQLWIAYMAFHLQATEIEKARAVAKKALNTISFREEQEKLNVWLALINLENRFGTKESQQKTLEDAIQMNDPFKIHSKLLDIYVETSKHQELSSLVDLMMRKYRRDPSAFVLAGGACHKLGLVDKARHVMQKAVSVLEKKQHVSVLVQFALLERNHGFLERAEALFEQVLAVYPQRVDVAAAYLDMLLKSADVERIRQVLERLTSHKLPARKMKILYKKWVEIEEKIGDEEQVEKVRQKAMEYVKTAQF